MNHSRNTTHIFVKNLRKAESMKPSVKKSVIAKRFNLNPEAVLQCSPDTFLIERKDLPGKEEGYLVLREEEFKAWTKNGQKFTEFDSTEEYCAETYYILRQL